jgi:hypothetical protein
MLIYAVVAIFITVTSENISSAIGVGMMLTTMFISYPFAVGEKSNMDALYITLSVNRKSVVLGRYAFSLVLNLCVILISYVLSAAGLFAASAIGIKTGIESPLAVIITLAAIFIIIQAIQLPIYFKFSYSKAKFFSMVPYVAMMAGYMSIMTLSNVSSRLLAFVAAILENAAFAAILTTVGLMLFVFVSYKLSSAFYRKREF